MASTSTVDLPGFLAALFDGATDGLCLVAPDGTVLRANQHWLRATGYFAEQVVGVDVLALFPEAREFGRELHARARAGERVEVPVHRQVILGQESWWDGTVAPVPMDGGVGLLITARELGPQGAPPAMVGRRTWAALDQARLLGLERRINEIELVVRTDGTIAHVNDRAIAAYGYSREELEGLDIRRIRQADPPALVAGQMAQAAREGIRFEAVHVRKDGSAFPVEVSSRAFEADGDRYLHSLVRDLTEQRRNEAALRLARERAEAAARELEVLLQTARVGISKIVDRRQVWLNGRMEEIFGYTVEEQTGQTTRMLYPTEEAYEALGRAAYGVLATGQAFETEQELVRKDGTHVWARYQGLAVDPADMAKGTLWILEDITAAKAERQRLAEAEARLARVLDGSMEAFFDVDLTTGVTSRSERVARMLGMGPRDLPNTQEGFVALLHPDDGAAYRTAVAEVVQGRKPSIERDLRARHADGSWRWLRLRGRLTGGGAGQGRHYSGTLTDITELRRGQEALAASEARYRGLFENLREEVTVYDVERDASGKVVDWVLRISNAAARRFLGEAHQAVVGRRLTEIAGEAQMRPIIDRTESILTGDVRTEELFVELTGRHYLATAFPLDQRTIVTAALDITDRVKAEAALRESLAANERTVAELRDALEHVKTLSGLLPICMHCHQIRDDTGYWSRLESYFRKHSDVLFSHSICPACAKKHYPELSED